MVYENPPFEVVKGDDVVLEFPVYEPTGARTDLTGATARFSYGPSSSALTVEKTGSGQGVSIAAPLDGSSGNVVRAVIGYTETAAMSDYARIYYQCRVTIAGRRETVATGFFTAKPSQ